MSPRRVLGIDLRQGEARVAGLARGLLGVQLVAATILPRRPEEPPDALGEAIRRWLAEHRWRPERVVVGLPRQDVFMRHLTLPPVRRQELRRAVEYELGRHLPIPADKVAFDLLVQRRERDGRWRLLLVAAPRSAVDRAAGVTTDVAPTEPVVMVSPVAHWTLHNHCCREFAKPSSPHVLVDVDTERVNVELVTRAGGIAVARTAPRSPEVTGQELGNFIRSCLESLQPGSGDGTSVVHALSSDGLPPGARQLNPLTYVRSTRPAEAEHMATAIGLGLVGLKRRRILDLRAPAPVVSIRQRSRQVAAVVLGCVILLGAGAWTWQALGERRQLRVLSAERRQLEPVVAQAQKELREADGLSGLLAAFDQDKAREVSKLDLLRDLTARFPSDVWLAQLVYKRGELEIIGYAPQAQSLIGMLEGSAFLKDATFTGDIEQERGVERFKIRIAVVAGGHRAR